MTTLPVQRVWIRQDTPGKERCCLAQHGDTWRLSGEVSVEAEDARLSYEIICDAGWITRTASIKGSLGAAVVDLQICRDAQGQWWSNGELLPDLAGCADIDLGFTPATNTLPIRRLQPAMGTTVAVTAAWLRFPDLTFSPLPQRYTALADGLYRYESANGSFTALLRVDEYALVLDYGDIWHAG
ncbi:putative glycolipid-binding domain-containing protein [Leeia oryzae]|uniref:putative glycolipid-binding domain-containing protein n=1 Tax=Leeia oryzae TaxID=356662 RepID=UPI0003664872|nr:putative glycolipid-binding domain-containing protein [Leeia oryzae]